MYCMVCVNGEGEADGGGTVSVQYRALLSKRVGNVFEACIYKYYYVIFDQQAEEKQLFVQHMHITHHYCIPIGEVGVD